jgi:hypothetical protein
MLFTVTAAASAVLCVGVCVLWVRSYWVMSYSDSHAYWIAGGRGYRDEFWAVSRTGGVCYAQQRLWTDDPTAVPLFRDEWHGARWEAPVIGPPAGAGQGFVPRTFTGFGWTHDTLARSGDLKVNGTSWDVAVPYWGLSTLLALTPAAWLWRCRQDRRRRRRRRLGLCLRCGYDLRACPAGRCSECGAEVPEIPAKGAAA